MQVVGGTLVHTASDLVRYLECPHLAILTRDVALGRLARPERDDPLAVRLQQRGGAVERDYLERLRGSGRTVVEVPRPGNEMDALADAARQTRDFLTSGVDAVAQAVLFDGTWLGYADVLERVGPQAEGSGVIASPHTYEVVDTKLAGVVQATAVIQLAQYTLQLNDATGTVPRAFHVVLGDGRRETIVTAHALAFTRLLRRDYLATMESAPPTGTSTERRDLPGFVHPASIHGKYRIAVTVHGKPGARRSVSTTTTSLSFRECDVILGRVSQQPRTTVGDRLRSPLRTRSRNSRPRSGFPPRPSDGSWRVQDCR